jgi:hypothetical protein
LCSVDNEKYKWQKKTMIETIPHDSIFYGPLNLEKMKGGKNFKLSPEDFNKLNLAYNLFLAEIEN